MKCLHCRALAVEISPLLYNWKTVYNFLDFTLSVAKQRTAFIKVKMEHQLYANVKTDQSHRFEDLDEALEFGNKKLKKSGACCWAYNLLDYVTLGKDYNFHYGGIVLSCFFFFFFFFCRLRHSIFLRTITQRNNFSPSDVSG